MAFLAGFVGYASGIRAYRWRESAALLCWHKADNELHPNGRGWTALTIGSGKSGRGGRSIDPWLPSWRAIRHGGKWLVLGFSSNDALVCP